MQAKLFAQLINTLPVFLVEGMNSGAVVLAHKRQKEVVSKQYCCVMNEAIEFCLVY